MMSASLQIELIDARLAVMEADFDVAAELAAARGRLAGRAGAIVSFLGLVREHFAHEPVAELYLEHYPGMTERSIATVIATTQRRWSLLDVLVIHRVGRLLPQDQIVYVQVASAHRADAHAACEYLMDYLKTEAVFWKREQRGASARWLEPTSQDQSRRDHWREES